MTATQFSLQAAARRFPLVVAILAVAFASGSASPANSRRISPAKIPVQAVRALGPFGAGPHGESLSSGRVEDVEADPFTPVNAPLRLLALSDAALWRSIDGGTHWTALHGLEQFGQWNFEVGTLAFDPLQRGVVLLASNADNRVPTSRGIYRSLDGGLSWRQPANYRPTCVDGSIGSPTVVTFHGHNAYAAGGCVVGTSSDDGASWSWSAPDAGGFFDGVASDSAGNVFACGEDGVFELRSAGWSRVVDFRGGGWALGTPDVQPCRITTSPVAPEHVFFTARWSHLRLDPNHPDVPFSAVVEAFRDPKGSWQWQDLKGGAHNNGREALVETRPVYDGFKQLGFDLYWNSDDLWYYQQCTLGSDFECHPGVTIDESRPNPPWTPLGYASGLHADAGHILFDPLLPNCVYLIADDGGLQRPSRGDCRGTGGGWSYSDYGMNALEPYDIALTSIHGRSIHTDVYAAAQDDGGYALLTGESGWRQADGGNDGFVVDATPNVSAGSLDSVRLFYEGDAYQYVAHRGFDSFDLALFDPFSNPPDVTPHGRTWPWSGLTNAQQIAQLADGRLVMAVAPAGPSPSAALFVSREGSSWSRLSGHTSLLPGRIGGEGGVSVLTTAPSTPAVMFVRVFGRLYRVAGSFASVRELLPGQDIGPFAASPAGHLLVFSCPAGGACAAGKVRESSDGGEHWSDLDTITRLATNDGFGGFYSLDDGDANSGQITSVAISPRDTSLLAVGTRGTGLFDSGDNGRSWERIPFLAPRLYNLRFDASGRLFVGSYGRGLFELQPAPNELELREKLAPRSATTQWTVAAMSYKHRPIAHLRVALTLVSGTLITPVRTVWTNRLGRATVSFARPTGHRRHVLVAHWSGPGNRELETEAVVPNRRPR